MNQDYMIVQCPRCGAKNRIPAEKKGRSARCGRCRAPLVIGPSAGAPAHPVQVTDASFQQEVLGMPGTVLVDFWAPWCGACRMVAPLLDQLAQEFSGRIRVAKLNVDDNPLTSSRYSIRSIPSLLFFKNGTLVNTVTGALPKEELKRQVQAVL
ncbi:MAG: thioredoxin [Desulfomonilia bacterium]|nr:thioredoxin [Deltaproteobacteria bacterium]MDX9762500.1 thioredoxin [Desulfomonilia bacterium]HPW70101.1 thioredoxin [Deltaproteobacteria bacterium]